MAIFRRKNSNIDTDGVSQIEFPSNTGRRWPMLFVALAAALIIALGLFYGGRWAYRSIFSDDEPAIPAEQTAKEDNTSTQPQATPQPTPAPSTSPGNGGAAATPDRLPNNGPGEVVALFIGTSLAAAGLHYIVTLRRQTAS